MNSPQNNFHNASPPPHLSGTGNANSSLSSTKSFSTMNNLKTFAMLAAMTAVLLIFGSMFGRGGLMIALGMTVLMNLGGYWFSDKIALAMSGAKEVSPAQAPQLHSMVESLCTRADLPKPRVYLIPEAAPNAFATGRNPQHSAVAVTQGLMQILNHNELAGVVAHELAHIKHRDILISSVAAMLAGALTHLAYMMMWFGGGGSDEEGGGNPLGMLGLLAAMVLAPIAAGLIQMAISRSREFEADRLGAEICGNPLWLADALRKLEMGANQIPMHHNDPATAHMYIVNPLRAARKANFASLFRTHPETEKRIARLETMARERAGMPMAY